MLHFQPKYYAILYIFSSTVIANKTTDSYALKEQQHS